MGLDLWFQQDVLRILQALASAGGHHGPDYLKALYDVGLAFGLHWPAPAGKNGGHIQTIEATPDGGDPLWMNLP